MELYIKGNKLVYQDKTKLLQELHSEEFYQHSNATAHKYMNDSWFVNELFINFIQNAKAFELFLDSKSVSTINAKESSIELYSYAKDIALKKKIKLIGSKKFSLFKSRLKFHGQILASSLHLIYLMLRIPYKKEAIITTDLALVRTPAAKGKIGALDVPLELEDPYEVDSIYRIFKRTRRVIWCIQSLFASYKHYRNLKKILKSYLGGHASFFIQTFYGKRLVHTNLYYYLLKSLLNKTNLHVFYTGNNLDRYAMIEEELTKGENIQLINIPHGLEYGFKFPKCFTGDVFYTTTQFASSYFNDLYQTKKFTFEHQIIKRIFCRKIGHKNKIGVPKIVYFSEPREPHVNHQIIQKLIPILERKNLNLSLKLHPKDAKEDYKVYGIEIIEDFNTSITNNVCFARKSTTLLEAIYNDSSSGAILINEKDQTIFNTFPSLQTEKIKTFTSIEELGDWIRKEYQNKLN